MLIELAEAFHERVYRKDEFLYYEGDPGIGLYVIRSGRLQVLVEDSDGEARPIMEMQDSDILGATCLLGGGIIKRTETVQALSETKVLGLFSPEFRTLQRRHPKTGAAVATLLARHFAQCLTASRSILAEREGPIAAATCLADARTEATAHAEPPPGW
jgi:CRP/FNR family transcriptional regulator, cyclic AMP receptor protein